MILTSAFAILFTQIMPKVGTNLLIQFGLGSNAYKVSWLSQYELVMGLERKSQ